MHVRLRSWLLVVLIQLPFTLVLGFVMQQSESIRGMLIYQTHIIERVQMCNEAFGRLFIASFLAPIPLTVYLLYWVRQKLALSETRQASLFLQTALLTGLFYAVLITRFLQYPVCQDDSYIDFRYVQHWFNGSSFDFNPGERVMGFTSHFHVLVLYVLSKIFQTDNIAVLSVVFNASLSCLVLIGLHALGLRLFRNGWQPLLACAIFTFSKFSTDEVAVGKETVIVDFLIVSSMLGLAYSRWAVFAWGSALLALTRPEGVLWLVSAIILSFVRRGKAAVKLWILPALPIILVYGFLFYYYGTIVPHGAIGRTAMFQHIMDPNNLTPCYILANLGTETFGRSLTATLTTIDFLANAIHALPHFSLIDRAWLAVSFQGLLALLALGLLGKDHQAMRFYFYACVLILLFFSIANPFVFSWYFSWFSLVPPLAVALIAGYLFRIKLNRATILFRVVTVAFCAYLIIHPLLLRNPIFAWAGEQDRIVCYQRAADFINGSNPGFTRSLGTGEPGAIAYYLIRNTKILDAGGLQSPQALQFYPVPLCDFSRRYVWNSIPVDVILKEKPDCFLSLDIWTDNGITKNETFMQDYSLVHFWPCTSWGSRGLYFFIRRDRIPDNSEEYSPGSAI